MTHIAVAGAGIGGLTAALALAQAGSSVTVLERRPGLAEFGAGLQLSPNATRILARLNLLDPIRMHAVEPDAVRVRRGRNGTDLIRFPLGGYAVERYGAPFLLVLRPTLQRVLAERANAAPGITIRFGVDVGAAVADSKSGVTVRSSAGDLTADGFVDARGVGVLPGATTSGRTAWRAMIDAADLPAGQRRLETNLWLGHRAHLVHYPMPGGARVNVVAITAEPPAAARESDDPWSHPGDAAVLRHAFRQWHPEALRLLDPEAVWRCWPLRDAAPLPAWSDGPMTRLGDAAHPMLPFLAQGASQAIEDAGSLAAALRDIPSVGKAFAAYDAGRRARATQVQAASRRQADIYHLGRPASDARDLALRILGGPRALSRMDWLYGA